MVPYLLPLAGIEHLVIGRIHNAHKEKMREAKKMRFNWAQHWDIVRLLSNDFPGRRSSTSRECSALPLLHNGECLRAGWTGVLQVPRRAFLHGQLWRQGRPQHEDLRRCGEIVSPLRWFMPPQRQGADGPVPKAAGNLQHGEYSRGRR